MKKNFLKFAKILFETGHRVNPFMICTHYNITEKTKKNCVELSFASLEDAQDFHTAMVCFFKKDEEELWMKKQYFRCL